MENLLDYFGEFSWVNIPNFCLITSKNGIGKSKLLKLIRYKLNSSEKLKKVQMTIKDNNKLEGITFSNGDSNVQDVSNGIKCYLIHFDGNFSDLKGERYDEDPRNINKIHKEVHFFKMQSDFKKIENYDENDFCLRIKGLIKFISENFNDQLENLNDKLKDSTLFGSSIEIIKSDENISSVEFKSDIHLENCDILNYSIEKDENEMLKIKILFKDNNQNEKNYTKKFYPDESNIEKVEVEYLVAKNQKNIKINQLSCGEQIILYLKLWSIIGNDVTLKKKFKSDILKNRDILLLLDEPDSFLNPSILNSIVKIIVQDIVERLDIQVIMTTHNPVTISFVEQFTSLNNIFCLCLNNQKMEIDKCENKENFSKLIHNELNSNLISIHQPFKFVYVEGKDSEFYEYYYEKIRAFDLLVIKTNCQIIFRPVQEKSKSNCYEVRKNIEIMINSISKSLKYVDQEVKLSSLIYGIIDNDGDNGTNNSNNLLILTRDGKENYVLDPINLFIYFIYKNNKNKNFEAIKTELGKNNLDSNIFNSIDEFNNFLNENENLISETFQNIINSFTKIIMDFLFDGSFLDKNFRVKFIQKISNDILFGKTFRWENFKKHSEKIYVKMKRPKEDLQNHNEIQIKKKYVELVKDYYKNELDCSYFIRTKEICLKVPQLFYSFDDHEYQHLINAIFEKEIKPEKYIYRKGDKINLSEYIIENAKIGNIELVIFKDLIEVISSITRL